MKKLLFAAALCLSAGLVNGQMLMASSAIVDAHGGTLGFMRPDGSIEDNHHSVIGYIQKDGTIQDSHHATIGFIKDDGTLQDSHHATIGHSNTNEMKYNVVFRTLFFKS